LINLAIKTYQFPVIPIEFVPAMPFFDLEGTIASACRKPALTRKLFQKPKGILI
jgi:hypothetical protein